MGTYYQSDKKEQTGEARLKKKMKILVTGARGQLGTDLVMRLEEDGYEVIPTDVEDMDITDIAQVEEWIGRENPDAVMHCAAWTNVDGAESNEEACRRINVTGTQNVAKVCGEHDIKMLYLSTDYIFRGTGVDFYHVDDEPDPSCVYGRTKYEGELAVKQYVKKYFIVRISWVFGLYGKNFIKTMIDLGRRGISPSVVYDQVGSPTYTHDLSILLSKMIATDSYGIYHATNEGVCSWFELAEAVFRECGMDDIKVTPVSTEEYGTAASRPLNSRMDKSSLTNAGFDLLPEWEDALHRFIAELGEAGETK